VESPENIYERACAVWVFRHEQARGNREITNPDLITDVELELDPGDDPMSWDPEGYNSMWTGASLSITYHYGGPLHKRYLHADGIMSPGKFVEECVEILKELEGLKKGA